MGESEDKLLEIWEKHRTTFEGSTEDIERVEQAVKSIVASPSSSSGQKEVEEKSETDLRREIDNMGIPEKIKLAMFGPKAARMILISDKNRMVQDCVLQNPRLSIAEVEEFALNPNTPEQVLRIITNNRDWVKTQSMKRALLFNPKTPVDSSLKFLKLMPTNDLRRIARSKNLPQVLASSAQRLLTVRSKKPT
ncbi:MAG: hypothetical protein KDD53_05370 [Bdellovibrionales bacterium]|nr:hypothetical protein [Bdellovibrionales bacterium]